jgi:hypothetical protein
MWSEIVQAKLSDVVALSCDIDPGSVNNAPREIFAEYARRLVVADNHASAKTLEMAWRITTFPRHPGDDGVRLATFAKWSEQFGWSLPSQFPRSPASTPKQPEKPGWPWGTYDTPLLKELAAAAEHFWASDFDPKSAPTNDDVIAWLVGRGVASERNADAIARILRRPDLPHGPRKKKFKGK